MTNQARQYLVSFLATIQGEKAVVTGLRQMEGAVGKYKKQAGLATGKTQSFNDVLKKAGSRALLVAPVWLALRAVMMLVIRTIGNMVRANLDLEEGMARIRTVMQGTSAEIDANMSVIERKIRDVASKTSQSLKQLAEAFYFLKTANLTAEEAMAGFEPVVNAMIGTGNSAKDMARAVAGMFNTMGNQMDETMTVTEKFTKIADVLTYTYATQDVQMSELTASYEKLAPYVAGLDDDFTDLVTMLGYLNTRLLRGGRTGRLTGRAILQLSKNAKQLAHEFGVTFDPNQPMSFITTLEKINEKMSGATKLTAKEGEALQKVFATRGGVAIRLLLQDFEDFTENLKRAREEADGFAEKMADIRMDTITAQMKRMENNFANLSGEFFATAIGAGDVVEAIKELNDWMESIRPNVRATGDAIGWVAYNLTQSALAFELLMKSGSWRKYTEEHAKMQLGLKSPADYLQDVLKREQEVAKKRKEQSVLSEGTQKVEEERIQTLKEEKEEQSKIVSLLKTMGAHELDIARYKLNSLELSTITRTEEEYKLELQKRQNNVLEAQGKIRQEIYTNFMSAEVDLLKTMGASEMQILRHKKDQIEANRELMDKTQYLMALSDNRRKTQIAIANELQKEKDIATDLAMQYYKADEIERNRLKRFFELRKLEPDDLSEAWEDNMFDRSVIDEYWKQFSDKGRQAVSEVIAEMFDLDIEKSRKGGIYPFESTKLEGEGKQPLIPQDFEDKLTQDIPKSFWDNWLTSEEIAMQKFAEDFKLIGTSATGYLKAGSLSPKQTGAREKIQSQLAKEGITIPIENIHVNLPENSLDRVAEETAKQIEEKLKTDEDLAKKIANIIRPHI